jgi:hypothetical protein
MEWSRLLSGVFAGPVFGTIGVMFGAALLSLGLDAATAAQPGAGAEIAALVVVAVPASFVGAVALGLPIIWLLASLRLLKLPVFLLAAAVAGALYAHVLAGLLPVHLLVLPSDQAWIQLSLLGAFGGLGVAFGLWGARCSREQA